MPTPASSVKFIIYEQGDEPRILTVFNPAQNIVYADIINNGLEAAIGVANLPDSPLKVDFLSDSDCYNFVTKLRHGLYNFDYTSDTSGWPEWLSIGSGPDDPLVLSNQASSANTTTVPEATTTTTTSAQSDAQIDWFFQQNASGTFKIYVNDVLIVNVTSQDAGTIYVSAGDTFYIEITDNGSDYAEINSTNWLNFTNTVSGTGNKTTITRTIVLGEPWTINAQSGN